MSTVYADCKLINGKEHTLLADTGQCWSFQTLEPGEVEHTDTHITGEYKKQGF